jgi:hypothetical protein
MVVAIWSLVFAFAVFADDCDECGGSCADCEFIRGDVNCDGAVNFTDCVIIGNCIFGSYSYCGHRKDAYDVNDDGLLNATDISNLCTWITSRTNKPECPADSCGYDCTPDALDDHCSPPIDADMVYDNILEQTTNGGSIRQLGSCNQWDSPTDFGPDIDEMNSILGDTGFEGWFEEWDCDQGCIGSEIDFFWTIEDDIDDLGFRQCRLTKGDPLQGIEGYLVIMVNWEELEEPSYCSNCYSDGNWITVDASDATVRVKISDGTNEKWVNVPVDWEDDDDEAAMLISVEGLDCSETIYSSSAETIQGPLDFDSVLNQFYNAGEITEFQILDLKVRRTIGWGNDILDVAELVEVYVMPELRYTWSCTCSDE